MYGYSLNMTLHVGKDLKFACRNGPQEGCSLWVTVSDGEGVSEIGQRVATPAVDGCGL